MLRTLLLKVVLGRVGFATVGEAVVMAADTWGECATDPALLMGCEEDLETARLARRLGDRAEEMIVSFGWRAYKKPVKGF
jgi:hypothetical protein